MFRPLQQILKKIYKVEDVVGTRFFQNINKHQQKSPVDGDGCLILGKPLES